MSPFDLITRVLAERLQGPEVSDGLRAALTADTVTGFESVLARAAAEAVLPAFAAAMRDLGLLGSLEPKLRAFLAIALAANADRNKKLREELASIGGVLNRAGIEPVLLKGAIRLVDDLYPDPGWRTMQDLDILVPEAEFAGALEALHEAGYVVPRQVAPQRKDVPLRRQRHGPMIEIHKELFSTARRQRLLRGAEVIEDSRQVALGDATARIPSVEHQLVHLIGHSQIGHRGHAYGRIALRDRLEAAAFARWSPERIGWDAVFARFAAAGYRRPMLAFLLSLNDGGLCAVPTLCRTDTLTALQRRRIALQARCRPMMGLSLYAVWYVVALKYQFTQREAGRPKILSTFAKLVVDRQERKRLTRMFMHGAPRPW